MEIIDTTKYLSNQEIEYIDKILLHAPQRGLSTQEFAKIMNNAMQEYSRLQVKSKLRGTATQEEEKQLQRYEEFSKFVGILQDFDEDEYNDAITSGDEEKLMRFRLNREMDQLEREITINMGMQELLDKIGIEDVDLDDEMREKFIQSFNQKYDVTRINEAINNQKFEFIDEDTMSAIAYLILKKKQFVEENDIPVLRDWIDIDNTILSSFIVKYLERHPIQINDKNEIQPIEDNKVDNDSIQMKIAKIAAHNWGQEEPTTLKDSLKITWNSEVSAVQGIVKALELDDEITEQLVGTKNENGELNRDGEIYTNDTISEKIASKIREGIQGKDKNKTILGILSTIHDNWVINNCNNFLKPDRNKERQFVPLELLNWEEVESDLLFLKPILEASGIEIDEKQLRAQHTVQQNEYLIDNKIFSHDDLVNHLSRGAGVYPILSDLETKNGGNISELLNNPGIAEKMAKQVESKVSLPSREDLATGIIKQDKSKLSSRDIAESDKEQALTTSEVGGIKEIINKIKEVPKEKEEKND